jgi:hypothetical protein
MPSYDKHSTVIGANLFAASEFIGDAVGNSNVVDLWGFEALEFVASVGNATPANASNLFSFEVYEANLVSLTDAAVVDPKYLIGILDFDGSDNFTAKRMGYVGKKRYVYLRLTVSGNTTATFSVVALKASPKFAPTDEN